MAKLRIESLEKRFGAHEVLSGIDLSIDDGEFVVFVGPSGCGKSTLLRTICGLEEISGGRLMLDGEIVNDVPPSKRGVAMVFQSYALYPHMSVARNMGYALRLAGTPSDEIDRRVLEAARVLQIEPLLDRKPRQLSGGQRQRVAIGRAIVREPRVFLFDEPLSNLDASLRVDMRLEFARLKQRLGTTMIYVTHDQVEAMTLADKIVVMCDGRIEQVGSPIELYDRPANRFVAGFIGSPKMNFLPAELEEGELRIPGGRVAVPGRIDGAVGEIGARPEHLALTESGAGQMSGRVIASEHLGSDTFAFVSVDHHDRPVVVRLAGEQRIPDGAAVGIVFDPARLHAFDAEGRSLDIRRIDQDAA